MSSPSSTGSPILDQWERWEERANDLSFNELSRIRASAEKWMTTIGALAGLTTILALLQGSDRIGKLDVLPKVLVIILLLAALAAAAWAIFTGALAAQGSPDPDKAIINDPDIVRNWYRQEAEKAARQLRNSRRAALAAVFLLGLGTALSWLWPAPAPSSPQTAAILQDGSVVCGELERDANGALSIKAPGSASKPVALTGVASMTAIAKCP